MPSHNWQLISAQLSYSRRSNSVFALKSALLRRFQLHSSLLVRAQAKLLMARPLRVKNYVRLSCGHLARHIRVVPQLTFRYQIDWAW
jgi:hypothetical protein